MNRLLFSKTGDAVYLSHLDLMRLFQRAFKRAGILIWHSQGFSPRAYVSIALPLSVGTQSRCEILDFEIQDGSVELASLPEWLNATMPAGIRVLEAYESDVKIKHLAWLRASVTLEYDEGVPEKARQALTALFERTELPVMKHTKSGEKEIDIRPMLHTLRIEQMNRQELQLDVTVQAQNPGLNPQLLVTAIETLLPAYRADFARILRLEVLDEEMRPFR